MRSNCIQFDMIKLSIAGLVQCLECRHTDTYFRIYQLSVFFFSVKYWFMTSLGFWLTFPKPHSFFRKQYKLLITALPLNTQALGMSEVVHTSAHGWTAHHPLLFTLQTTSFTQGQYAFRGEPCLAGSMPLTHGNSNWCCRARRGGERPGLISHTPQNQRQQGIKLSGRMCYALAGSCIPYYYSTPAFTNRLYISLMTLAFIF